MKKLLIIVFLSATTLAFSQKNTVFIETIGNGGFASLNYERQLTGKTGLTLRIGVGVSFLELEREDDDCTGNPYCDFLNFPDSDLSIPVSLQYLFDIKNNNYLETGLGYTYQFGSMSSELTSSFESALNIFYGSLGFRRHFGKTKGWMWKVNFSPIIGVMDSEDSEFGFTPWGGISIGKRF